MSDLDEYVRWKLTLKLNLLVTNGISKSGIISENTISKMMSFVTNLGYYEIILNKDTHFPIGLVQLDARKFVLSGTPTIEFTLKELRARKLKLMGI